MGPLPADLLGYAAGAMTTLSFLPQAVKTLRTRRTKDISLAMYVLFTMGISSWLAYGLLIGSWPVVLANAITLALALAILIMKLRFDRYPPSGRADSEATPVMPCSDDS
jgi:MtN3 and saliva related transmembrane protein